jgi:integrase
MASVVSYNGGLKRIEFSLVPNGARKSVRLGHVNSKIADSWCAKIEAMIADKLANRPHDAELSSWLGGLDESMLARLRAGGLADGVGLSQVTLKEFMDRFFNAHPGKDSTRVSYGNVRRNLEEFLGAQRLVSSISAADADDWRAWLDHHEKLSTPTISRRVIAARTMWRKAIRWKLAAENPFVGVKAGKQENDARKMFVPHKTIGNIIAHAPDTEWKVIIALARYGGLRCPSEIYALKWTDIDWEQGTIRVSSIKTQHHEGHSERTVPLFPELRGHLLKLFDEAEPGSSYVITKNRLESENLRTRFEEIIKSAAEKQWPRLFQNLRASRETELMRKFDLATVCKWIGNSPAVAAKHYAMSIDLNADFERASVKGPPPQQAQQNAQQSPASSECRGMTSEPTESLETSETKGLGDDSQKLSTADQSDEWAIQGSNLRPQVCDTCALAN